jgi:hypothetical protein
VKTFKLTSTNFKRKFRTGETKTKLNRIKIRAVLKDYLPVSNLELDRLRSSIYLDNSPSKSCPIPATMKNHEPFSSRN